MSHNRTTINPKDWWESSTAPDHDALGEHMYKRQLQAAALEASLQSQQGIACS